MTSYFTVYLTRLQVISCIFWNAAHTAAHALNVAPDPAAVRDRAGDSLTLQHKLALMAWIIIGGRPMTALRDVVHRNRRDVPGYRRHLDRHTGNDGISCMIGVHSMLGTYGNDRPIQVMSWKEKNDDAVDGLDDLVEYERGEHCAYALFSVREREAVLNIIKTGVVPEFLTVRFHGWISSTQLLDHTQGCITRYNNGSRIVLEAPVHGTADTLLDFFYGDERPHGLPPVHPPPPPPQTSQVVSPNNSQDENRLTQSTSTRSNPGTAPKKHAVNHDDDDDEDDHAETTMSNTSKTKEEQRNSVQKTRRAVVPPTGADNDDDDDVDDKTVSKQTSKKSRK